MKQRWYQITLIFFVSLSLLSCAPDGEKVRDTPSIREVDFVDSMGAIVIVTGQTVFIPAYTEIYLMPDRTVGLTASIGVHNTDPESPIIIQSVRSYATDGTFIKEYIEKPFRLAPMASRVFVTSGPEKGSGIGGNFIVEWIAENAVQEPVIEAIMISSAGTQGFSLTSPGRVVKQIK